jgi:hypothetical protein
MVQSVTMNPTDMIPLKNVNRHFASRPHYKTVLRWTSNGLLRADGTRVVLKVSHEGGRVFTTLADIQAFKRALNPQ